MNLYLDNQIIVTADELKECCSQPDAGNPKSRLYEQLKERFYDGDIAEFLRSIGEESLAEKIIGIKDGESELEMMRLMLDAITGNDFALKFDPTRYVEILQAEVVGEEAVLKIKVLKKTHEKVHFEIRQGSMVIWEKKFNLFEKESGQVETVKSIIHVEIGDVDFIMNKEVVARHSFTYDIAPKRKLQEIRTKLDSLQKFTESMPLELCLKLASLLRTQIINDSNITSSCSLDHNMAMSRSQLLADIESYQKALIQDTCRKDESVNVKEQVSIESLDEAKRGLAELVDDELTEEVAASYSKEYAQHIETLKRISDECKTGKYIVLFMGEYQSGKTTTLNAICGGKNIGSIGDGNATSAVPVAVSYGETWSVTVDWKTPEILCNILCHLSREFEDFDMNEFDVENSKQRKQWLERIENLRKDRRSCPTVGEEELKFLVLSSIILKHYASESLAKKAKQVFPYSDISHLTKFPKDMETRWYDNGVNAFGIEESLFSFIGRVNCTCPSENLKQLNCTIVDCPGLFSNDYDTEVTEKAMRDAHAIIYFLPYHKGIGQDVCRSLYKIQEEYTDFHRKLFVINNLSLVGNTDFIETNRVKIKQMFGPEKELYAYDARLAYLAAIRQTYDNKGLTEAEIEGFIEPIMRKDIFGNVKKIEFKIFDEKWSFLMKQYMSIISDWYGNANPTATELFSYSGLPMVLKQLKAFTDNNEAYAMILSNGIYKLSDELKEIRNSLRVTNVEPYILEGAECQKKWKQRLANAAKFNEQEKEVVNKRLFKNRNNAKSLCDTLTDHVYENLFPTSFYEEMAKEIAGIVFDKKEKLFEARFNKKNFSEILEPLIKDAVCKKITGRFDFWNRQIGSGQDEVFSRLFMPENMIIERELNDLWNQIFGTASDDSINNYVTFPKSTKDFYLMTHNTDGKDVDANVLVLSVAILAEIATVVAGVAGIITSITLGIIAATASNPLGWIVAAISAAGVGIAILTQGKEAIRNLFIDVVMFDKIYSELGVLKETVRNGLSSEIRKQLKIYQDKLQCDIQKMENERDTALATPADQKEAKCFAAVGCMSKIDNQLKAYKDFVSKYVRQ